MCLSAIIQEIQAKAEVFLQKCGEINDEHGIPPPDEGISEFSMADANQMHAVIEQAKPYDEFIQFLSTFEINVLLKIEAIMYLGRDKGFYQTTYNLVEGMRQSKMEVARKIAEKSRNLAYYFAAAIKQLKNEGLDINNL